MRIFHTCKFYCIFYTKKEKRALWCSDVLVHVLQVRLDFDYRRLILRKIVNLYMKIEEAIVFVLASSNHGMKIEQIAKEINEKGLFTRWDKNPVDGRMVYAVVMSHPETFVKSDGLIRLMI